MVVCLQIRIACIFYSVIISLTINDIIEHPCHRLEKNLLYLLFSYQ